MIGRRRSLVMKPKWAGSKTASSWWWELSVSQSIIKCIVPLLHLSDCGKCTFSCTVLARQNWPDASNVLPHGRIFLSNEGRFCRPHTNSSSHQRKMYRKKVALLERVTSSPINLLYVPYIFLHVAPRYLSFVINVFRFPYKNHTTHWKTSSETFRQESTGWLVNFNLIATKAFPSQQSI